LLFFVVLSCILMSRMLFGAQVNEVGINIAQMNVAHVYVAQINVKYIYSKFFNCFQNEQYICFKS